jgi:hypothetical protein
VDLENADKLVWIAKLCQFVAAVILTPEIIGPDRLERLEKRIELQDFSKRENIIWLMVFVLGFTFTCPWVFLDASRMKANASNTPWVPPFGSGLVHFLFLLNILGLIVLGGQHLFTRLIQTALTNLVSYLRKVSLLRTVFITVAVLLFFLGTVLELVLEWPF